MTHIRTASDGMARIGLGLVAALAIGLVADWATADDYGDGAEAPYGSIAILASDHGPDPKKPGPPRTHVVRVKSDGSFVPPRTHVKSGDVVRWELSDPTDSIIPATWSGKFPAICSTPKPYDPSDPNDFTGPMIQAASGIFSISPGMLGAVVEQGGCSAGVVGAQVGNTYLCKGAGRYQETMDATWEDPHLTGVFIRLLWKDVQIAPGTADSSFDFTVLDREIGKAVKNGKLYALGFKAGDDGTPEWIFASGVTRLPLRDAGSDDDAGCGFTMDLGDPTEAAYQAHYRDLLEKVAARIKGRADWYRALAYIKPSGANLVSHENRLPKRCKEDCPICNTQVFAENGYRPSGLYAFYARQEADMRSLFPGKTMSYALIQVGFPRVNEQGEWEVEGVDGSTFVGGCTPPNCHPLPGGTEQTQTIIDQGTSTWGLAFAVQHNGLGPEPSHPNPLVVEKGNAGQVTGFQTSNEHEVASPQDLESTVANGYDNSAAIFIEAYEERLWEAENAGLPSGKTIGEWAQQFHDRRRAAFPTLGPSRPTSHSHTFVGTSRGERKGEHAEELFYIHGSKCGVGHARYGVVVIER